MRFVLAIVSFVIAIVMIGWGIAQRTFLAAPDDIVAAVSVESTAPVTVIDGAALNAFDGSQSLDINGSGQVFAAYGRTSDVLAWIGDASYNLVTYVESEDETGGALESELVVGTETEVPDPNGSDLWLDDYVKDDTLAITVNVPDDISFIIVSDGVKPAPSDITVTWPVDNSTPWAGPLIVGGGVLLLAGLGFLLWALQHMRRSRGPRRKQPKLPKVPRGPRVKQLKRSNRPAIEASGRRAARRPMVAIPIVLVATLGLSACTSDFWPGSGSAPEPSASPTSAEETGADIPDPAVTVRQVERIVARISAVAAEADTNRDAALAETRFSGPALALRKADYVIRGADGSIAGLPAIPAGPVKVTLPEQTDSWPRTVFVVVQDEANETAAPIALLLVQPDPRAQYTVEYAMSLEPSAKLPDVAPASVGAPRLSPDIGLFALAPDQLADAYGDILLTDIDSPYYLSFEGEGDSLRAAVGLEAKNAARAALSSTASITFETEPGPADPIVLATNDSGALVAVNLHEITTVAPVETGAAVNPSGAVKALSGIGISVKGVRAVYGDQLLFYVPSAASGGKIILLGYSQGLVSAGEI